MPARLRFISLFLAFLGFASCLSAQAVTLTIETSLGDIVIELDAEAAPITATNFLRYVDGGSYEGGTFYRTVRMDNQPNNDIRIEVIQGGANDDTQSYAPIPLERTTETGLLHLDGTLSMARGEPDSATHAFFICIGDQPSLDFAGQRNPDGQGFAAFGRVLSGMDVVRQIQAGRTNEQTLIEPIVIRRIVRL